MRIDRDLVVAAQRLAAGTGHMEIEPGLAAEIQIQATTVAGRLEAAGSVPALLGQR